MSTERVSPRYADIDRWEPADILDSMIEAQMAAVAAVRGALSGIEHAAAAAEARLRDGGRLVYVGAGTSGRLAVQDGAELVPTFNWPLERLLLLMAGGNDALLRSAEGAEDETATPILLMQRHRIATPDVIIAVAASGTTPFTLACLREARRRGALTISIANNRGSPLLQESDCPILLDTGPEPIAGSTRMKAGTAQRVALNLLSSLVMIRLGRVHDGLMVDVQAINDKLQRRSERILRRLTGGSSEDCRDALSRADGRVKLAVLLMHGCSVEQARNVLARAGGRLRTALDHLGVRDRAGLLPAAVDVPAIDEDLPTAVDHDDESANAPR